MYCELLLMRLNEQKVSLINITQINTKQYTSSNCNRYSIQTEHLKNRVLNRCSSGLNSCDLTF